jgi:hypothetical protein
VCDWGFKLSALRLSSRPCLSFQGTLRDWRYGLSGGAYAGKTIIDCFVGKERKIQKFSIVISKGDLQRHKLNLTLDNRTFSSQGHTKQKKTPIIGYKETISTSTRWKNYKYW